MNIPITQTIKVDVSDETSENILNSIQDSFKSISATCKIENEKVVAESINATFGSILRNDVTTIEVKENRKKDGYVIDCMVVYKPSMFFWIFVVLDFVLIATIIGFVLGLGATLGIYFYHKKIVVNNVNQNLQNVINEYA